jgi:hypothetical protein
VTTLLLDYPWSLEDALGQNPEPSGVLERFLRLLERTGLAPAPFISQEQCLELWTSISQRRGGNRFGPLMRLIDRCSLGDDQQCLATPVEKPQDRSVPWRRGLRSQLTDPNDWRKPYIVVPSSRRDDWPEGDEARLMREPCGNSPASGPHARSLVVLERFLEHRYALADLDPWDVRCSVPGGAHPCYLPNPLVSGIYASDIEARIPLNEIAERLATARGVNWQAQGKYFYIPPGSWDASDVSQAAWRQGHAFPRKLSTARNQVGYVDYRGHIWVWDHAERHWDVQRGGDDYVRVNHMGDKL